MACACVMIWHRKAKQVPKSSKAVQSLRRVPSLSPRSVRLVQLVLDQKPASALVRVVLLWLSRSDPYACEAFGSDGRLGRM